MARVAGDPAIDPSGTLMTQNSAPTRVPAKVTAPGMPGLNDLLSLAVAVVVAALYFAREVPIPITMAVILSVMPAPLVASLQHWHVPPVAAVPLALLVDRWGRGGSHGSLSARLPRDGTGRTRHSAFVNPSRRTDRQGREPPGHSYPA
jgi:hypothetical protein